MLLFVFRNSGRKTGIHFCWNCCRGPGMERRLAAVLIADVVGYSRLSEIDEEGTRARFQADLNEVFEPNIGAHHGRLVKTMGDGLLVEFQSVVDALRCAVEVQREKGERNAAASQETRLVFRIGVNLGDIMVEGEDIHGDGVNIADRIQTLAEPGGIAISGTTYDQVKSKLPVGYVSLGEQMVKNIAEPIRIYRVVLDPAGAGKTVGAPETLAPMARAGRCSPCFDLARRRTAVVETCAVVPACVTCRAICLSAAGQAFGGGAAFHQCERRHGA